MFRRHLGGLTDKATLAVFANVTMVNPRQAAPITKLGLEPSFIKVAPNLAGVTPLRD